MRHQQIFQRHARAKQPRPHGVQRYVQERRDLHVAQLLVLPQQKDFAVVGVEAGDRLAYPERRVGICGHGGLEAFFLAAAFPCFLSSFCRQQVERNAVEITPESRARLVARCAVQYGQEGLLSQILGALGVGRSTAEKAIDGLAVAFEELNERRVRPLLELLHQLFVGGHRRLRHPTWGLFLMSTLHDKSLTLCNVGKNKKVPAEN